MELPPKSEIALKAPTGRFLTRWYRNGKNPIEAAKDCIDRFCEFEMTYVEINVVTLRADNGLHLSRIGRKEAQTIEAAKLPPDEYSRFII